MTITEVIHGRCPSKSNCYKIIKLGEFYSLGKQKQLSDYEKLFYHQCKNKFLNIADYFKISIHVYYADKRPDIDNSTKIILDCLQMCKVIENDRNCLEINAKKCIDKKDPRIEIKLTIIDDFNEYTGYSKKDVRIKKNPKKR